MPRSAAALLAITVALSCRPVGDGRQASGLDTASAADPAADSRTADLPSTPAGRLVARSVAFHDSAGVWWRRPLSLRWISSRPGGEERVAGVEIDNDRGSFELAMTFRGHELEMSVLGDSVRTTVDGSNEVPGDVRELLRLDREGGLYWRNYFLFLVGLPMKLADPGVGLAEEVTEARFDGRGVRAVRVRYDAENRYPWWEFYFDAADTRLVGARFWREGPDVDGEYITMEGLAEAGPLRIPAARRWYTNAAGEHLGTDRVQGLQLGGG